MTIKETDDKKKASLMFHLEKCLLEENTKQKDPCYIGFRVFDEIQNLNYGEL